jgi:hypothetical protein
MVHDPREELTPTRLSKAVGISVPYASQLLSGRKVPPMKMAVDVFRATGVKLGPLSGASDDEIEVIARFQGAA